jgi:hypothetical protein
MAVRSVPLTGDGIEYILKERQVKNLVFRKCKNSQKHLGKKNQVNNARIIDI